MGRLTVMVASCLGGFIFAVLAVAAKVIRSEAGRTSLIQMRQHLKEQGLTSGEMQERIFEHDVLPADGSVSLNASTAGDTQERLSEYDVLPAHRSARGPSNERQHRIVEMMSHAFKHGYAKYCWGADELYPKTKACGRGWHLGLSLVDSLDTLYLMGLDEEFQQARDWVANDLDFSKVGNVNLFETTIRVLGGLLGAYDLSNDRVFLEKATELGDRLLVGVQGRGNGIPFSDIHVGGTPSGKWLGGDASSAEATTLGLEFRKLSQLTGSHRYQEAVDNVSKTFHGIAKTNGLLQITVDPRTAQARGIISLGSRGDSYYEYLLKGWLLTGKRDEIFLQDYKEAMAGVQQDLLWKTSGPLGLTYVGERLPEPNRKMDHLVCFLPGLLALGAHNGVSDEHMGVAKELMRTCYEIYKASGHMLGAEIAYFDTDGEEILIKRSDAHDILRPETVESLFYLYQLTQDKKYQEWGWEIAQAIERYAKVESGGYTSLASVLESTPPQRDKMESFFLAETLKYLYLLFDDSGQQVPLDKFVFNTEAHPLRIDPNMALLQTQEDGS